MKLVKFVALSLGYNNNNIIIKPYLYSALQNISRRFTIKMQDIILDNTWIIEATKEIHNNNGNNNSYMIKILRIQYDYIDIIKNIKNTI